MNRILRQFLFFFLLLKSRQKKKTLFLQKSKKKKSRKAVFDFKRIYYWNEKFPTTKIWNFFFQKLYKNFLTSKNLIFILQLNREKIIRSPNFFQLKKVFGSTKKWKQNFHTLPSLCSWKKKQQKTIHTFFEKKKLAKIKKDEKLFVPENYYQGISSNLSPPLRTILPKNKGGYS